MLSGSKSHKYQGNTIRFYQNLHIQIVTDKMDGKRGVGHHGMICSTFTKVPFAITPIRLPENSV
jgi:hypothetical protein